MSDEKFAIPPKKVVQGAKAKVYIDGLELSGFADLKYEPDILIVSPGTLALYNKIFSTTKGYTPGEFRGVVLGPQSMVFGAGDFDCGVGQEDIDWSGFDNTCLNTCKFCGAPKGTPCTKQCDDNDIPDCQVKSPPRCTKCGIELCVALDAYFGSDESKKTQCSKCQRS